MESGSELKEELVRYFFFFLLTFFGERYEKGNKVNGKSQDKSVRKRKQDQFEEKHVAATCGNISLKL